MLLKQRTITSTQGNDYVDLGLPSGLLWAKCNIGANKPYEYGDYFMWGSTTPNTNDDCDWKHYPFNNGYYTDYYCGFNEKNFKTIQKQICPNDILAPKYDAAKAILGDDWRLPTNDEFQELIDNTKHEWIKDYQGSNISGVLFKSNSIENDAELFIPASGFRAGFGFVDRGICANLWSSSLYTSSPFRAGHLYVDEYSCDGDVNDDRTYGFCLRGVKEI